MATDSGPDISTCANMEPSLQVIGLPTIQDDGPSKKQGYQYDHLSNGSIRLLRLLPDEDEHAPVRCRFIVSSLSQWGGTRPYDALSYVWGSDDRPQTIDLMDCSFDIWPNLHAALLHLRDPAIDRIFWIDAICINQKDNDEKGHQVGSMAEIYAKANRVILWLGKAADESDLAIDLIRETAMNRSKRLPSRSKESHQGILRLIERPWFQRIWALQEIAAARELLIKCGCAEISGYAFCSGLGTLILSHDAHPDLQKLARSAISLMKDAVYRPRNMPVTSQPGRFSLGIHPLGELLDMYQARKATMVQDKIYALLGMSSDLATFGLSADYNKPWGELFKQVVRCLLSENVSVETCEDKQVAAIQGHGGSLGRVSSIEPNDAGSQTMEVDIRRIGEEDVDLPEKISGWMLEPLAKTVCKDDIICLVQGTPKPIILRPKADYLAIIAIAVSPPDILVRDLAWSKISRLVSKRLRPISMVWNWANDVEDDEEFGPIAVGAGCVEGEIFKMRKAARFWINGVLFNDIKEHKIAESQFHKAMEVFETDWIRLKNSDCGWGNSDMDSDVINRLINGDTGSLSPLLAAGKKASHEMVDLVSHTGQHDAPMPLLVAAEGGYTVVFMLLRSLGQIDPYVKDEHGDTPLMKAARNGHGAIVQLLLDSGKVNLDYRGKGNRTPLMEASRCGHSIVVQQLLSTRRADPYAKDDSGNSSLVLAAGRGCVHTVRLLLDDITTVDPNIRQKNWEMALASAAENGHQAVLRLLLDITSVNPDAIDEDRQTPLMLAAKGGHHLIVQQLLKIEKVRVNAAVGDVWGGHGTALTFAAEGGHDLVVQELLKTEKIDVNATGSSHVANTALMSAAERGYNLIVQGLLETGKANPDIRGLQGRTALTLAAENGHHLIVRQLLGTGKAMPDIGDKYGTTALMFAAMEGHDLVVQELLSIGKVDPNIWNSWGRTALMFAAEKGHTVIVQQLLETENVILDVRDQDGLTALQIAEARGRRLIFRKLLFASKLR